MSDWMNGWMADGGMAMPVSVYMKISLKNLLNTFFLCEIIVFVCSQSFRGKFIKPSLGDSWLFWSVDDFRLVRTIFLFWLPDRQIMTTPRVVLPMKSNYARWKLNTTHTLMTPPITINSRGHLGKWFSTLVLTQCEEHSDWFEHQRCDDWNLWIESLVESSDGEGMMLRMSCFALRKEMTSKLF